MRVRIKFCKKGAIRFIGHLDVMRYFQKCLRRAKIDVAYTTGYSPHQIMTFASPLGVGLTSDGEYMEIECNSVTTSREMMERINAVSVPEIRVLSVRELPKGSENAMASVAAADYLLSFRSGYTPLFDGTRIADFLAQEEIPLEKETKSGTTIVNLREGIYEMEEREGGIRLLVNASSSGNIKPLQVLEAYARFCGSSVSDSAVHIHRLDTYTRIEEGGKEQLVSMGEIGEEILMPKTDEERIRIEQESIRRKKEAMIQAEQLRMEMLQKCRTENERYGKPNADHHENA